MRLLIREKSHSFRAAFTGKVLPAITLNAAENADAGDGTPGMTDNFLPLHIDTTLPSNRMLSVMASGIGSRDELICEVATPAFA